MRLLPLVLIRMNLKRRAPEGLRENAILPRKPWQEGNKGLAQEVTLAESSDLRLKESRSAIPPAVDKELAPDQQTLELEPLTSLKGGRFSRRSFLSGLGATGLLAGAGPLAVTAPVIAPEAEEPAATSGTGTVTLRINGKEYTLRGLDTRATLLDTLRERHAPDRHQERLRPRPMRRLHRAREWAARE